jgi:hypothetical protein
MLKGHLTSIPKDGYYEFRGVGTLEPVLGGLDTKVGVPKRIQPF